MQGDRLAFVSKKGEKVTNFIRNLIELNVVGTPLKIFKLSNMYFLKYNW